MPNKTSSSNLSAVVSVRRSVVDIRFATHLPPIYSLLHAKDGAISIEVLAQLDSHRVRGIALTPTQGLVRGNAVEDTGGPPKAPVGKGTLSRMFDVFGNSIDRQAPPADVEWRTVHRAPPALARRSTKSEIFETGIKAIDVGESGTLSAIDLLQSNSKMATPGQPRRWRHRPMKQLAIERWENEGGYTAALDGART